MWTKCCKMWQHVRTWINMTTCMGFVWPFCETNVCPDPVWKPAICIYFWTTLLSRHRLLQAFATFVCSHRYYSGNCSNGIILDAGAFSRSPGGQFNNTNTNDNNNTIAIILTMRNANNSMMALILRRFPLILGRLPVILGRFPLILGKLPLILRHPTEAATPCGLLIWNVYEEFARLARDRAGSNSLNCVLVQCKLILRHSRSPERHKRACSIVCRVLFDSSKNSYSMNSSDNGNYA